MQIVLAEAEVKKAVTEYLERKFIVAVQITDITMSSGLKTKEVVTTVDLTMDDPLAPVAEKKCQCAARAASEPVKEEDPPEPKPTKASVLGEPQAVLGEIPAPVKEVVPPVVEKVTPPEVLTPAPPVENTPPATVTKPDPFVEGDNVMTDNFDLAPATPAEAAPIVDDTEDLFNC